MKSKKSKPVTLDRAASQVADYLLRKAGDIHVVVGPVSMIEDGCLTLTYSRIKPPSTVFYEVEVADTPRRDGDRNTPSPLAVHVGPVR